MLILKKIIIEQQNWIHILNNTDPGHCYTPKSASSNLTVVKIAGNKVEYQGETFLDDPTAYWRYTSGVVQKVCAEKGDTVTGLNVTILEP